MKVNICSISNVRNRTIDKKNYRSIRKNMETMSFRYQYNQIYRKKCNSNAVLSITEILQSKIYNKVKKYE
ncbi:MAG: hypothetical protein ACFFB4_07245 [Promethearchaeota archaeon]